MTSIPATIAEYQVIRALGAGGMGRVFLVRHVSLGVERVLKQILPEHAGNDQLVRRFLTEARAVAKLQHRNVVVVHDFRTDADGQPFLVLEYLRGTSLASYLATWRQRASAPVAPGVAPTPRGVSPALVAIVLVQTANALTAAHAVGLIHRDIKPDNIFLVAAPDDLRADLSAAGAPLDFHLKILDFGIARIVSERGLTGTGVGIGTPEYMAPEQLEGRDVTAQADQYSCGAMAYQLLTGGSVPWGAETPAVQIYQRQRSEPPPDPRTIEPSISPALSDVVRRAMAANPADRWPSVAAFARAFAAAVPASDGLPAGLELLKLYARELDSVASAPTQLAIESLPATDVLPSSQQPAPPRPTTLGSSAGSRDVSAAPPATAATPSRRGLATAGGAVVAVAAAAVALVVVLGGGGNPSTAPATVPVSAVPADAGQLPDAAPHDAAAAPDATAPPVDAAPPHDAAPPDAPKRKHRSTTGPGSGTGGTTIHPI